MNKPINIVTAFLLAAGALAVSATGCELIASVDRGKINGTGGSSGSGGGTSSTSTSSTSSSSSGSGGGCAGGVMACTDASTCPAPTNDCVKNTCTMGCCGTTNVMASTACTSGGGKVCDGMGKCVGCAATSDCMPQTTMCIANTCTAGACGTVKAPAAMACNDNGGKVCDGNGVCVACLADADCPATGTVCATAKCDTTAHTCSTVKAAKGTTCTDAGGTVCDGSGMCVSAHCNDGIMDADETDVDCGGSCGATCKDTGPQQKCKVGGDCISKVCSGSPLLCQPPSCTDNVKNGTETDKDCGGPTCPKCAKNLMCTMGTDCLSNLCMGLVCTLQPDGGPCTTSGQCANNACVGTVCCATACTDMGAATCGTNGQCKVNGSACQDYASGTSCLPATCTGGMQTTASQCNGTGTCTAGTTTSCGNYVCGATACKTTCSVPADCATGNYCNGGACVPKITAGGACTGDAQCVSGACGTTGTGNCCTAACVTGGTCGATACSGTGACTYPTASTSCGAVSCSVSTLTPAGSCSGTGTCTPGTPSPCAGHLTCATGTTCNTGCGANTPGGDALCTTGYWCDGVGAGGCQLPQATGAACTRGSQCASTVCTANACT